MNAATQAIQAEARRLLEEGQVRVVIGHGAGSTPARSTPVFVESPEQVEQLIFTPACSPNLARYVQDEAKGGRVAVVAKSCDAAALVTLIQERQISREDVYVIGVPCRGTLEAGRLPVDEGSLAAVDWTNGGVRLTQADGAVDVPGHEVFKSSCTYCRLAEPPISDMLVPDEPRPALKPAGPEIPEGVNDRLAYWAKQFERCIRCYACRQVCPACYCTECFADRMDVKWVSKKMAAPENWMYHTSRAMHLAGRCVGCGECERVCPAGIPIQAMMREMARDVEEMFQFRAGVDVEAEPVLGSFREDDVDPHG